MLAVKGIYDKGKILLNEPVKSNNPVEVIVTFLDITEKDEPVEFDLKQLSLKKSTELLKDLKTSLSDEIIKQRDL